MMRLPSLMPRSLRGRVLLAVAGALLPLTLAGMWLVRGAHRSGEALLRTRMDAALAEATAHLSEQWPRQRAELLALVEHPAVQSLLRTPDQGAGREVLPLVLEPHAGPDMVTRASLRAADGRREWIFTPFHDSVVVMEPVAAPLPPAAGIRVEIPVWRRGSAERLGTLTAVLRPALLLPPVSRSSGAVGVLLAVLEADQRVALTPLPFDPRLLGRAEFTWGEERWLVTRRSLEEPSLIFAAAAPIGPYVAPFEQAARRGALVLLALFALTLLGASLVARRLTRSLEQLALAADHVSRGNLEWRVEPVAEDEVARVAQAFNTMTESLRRTLAELSRRQALAAVGSFAAALAHEIRNPLTAIRVDLQRVEEQLPEDAGLRVPLARALQQIAHLDHTVTGALRVARSGQVAAAPTLLRLPIERAMHAAGVAFARADAELHPMDGFADFIVHADADALQQLFLNLLLNAAQALGPGGSAGVRVERLPELARVTVWDTGPGIAEAARARAFEPFYSTRRDGTGLGLAVARQIAVAHGGDIELRPGSAGGTEACVVLPISRLSPAEQPEDSRNAVHAGS